MLGSLARSDEVDDHVEKTDEQTETADTELNGLKENLRLILTVVLECADAVQRGKERLLKRIGERRWRRGFRGTRWSEETRGWQSEEYGIEDNQSRRCHQCNEGDHQSDESGRGTGGTTG